MSESVAPASFFMYASRSGDPLDQKFNVYIGDTPYTDADYKTSDTTFV